ncbi:AraC family transcriptional regulator [Marinobacterium sediminicola]|nr:helix-turn-helix transcriptional regulator [Marinobacterium sediminicola]ULG70431.1 helix-turn-helix transcriptional regulator [Marinobacterium sediminicola]
MSTLPRQVYVRQQLMPARHLFPPHTHAWHQLLYATSGTLVASLEGQRLFVPSGTAVWLPAGVEHSTFTEFGAELKSLYIETVYNALGSETPLVLEVSPLMRELMLAAADFEVEYPLEGYEHNLIQLMLQTLGRLPARGHILPWPADSRLAKLCAQLYANPAERPGLEQIAASMAMSARTLERHFRRETGLTLQSWYSRLRLMKAIEMLSTDMSITRIALELGYSAPAPFILMFREHLGISPNRYRSKMRPA